MAKRGRNVFVYAILLGAKTDVYFKSGFLSRRKKGKNKDRKKEKSVTIIKLMPTWASQVDWQLSPLKATGSPVVVLAASHSKPVSQSLSRLQEGTQKDVKQHKRCESLKKSPKERLLSLWMNF